MSLPVILCDCCIGTGGTLSIAVFVAGHFDEPELSKVGIERCI
jgi:hypothetical protein